MKGLFKMVVNVEKLLKMVKMVIFQNLSKNGEVLKNVNENMPSLVIIHLPILYL